MPPLALSRELVWFGQGDLGLEQVNENAQTDERRQAEDLLTRTQSDQGQHATDADAGRSAGWMCAMASANGAFEVASDEPRMPCAIT